MSVIVTTLNRLGYLRLALASVEAQTYRNLQVVVLDDGSTDGTPDFLRRFRPWFELRVEMAGGRERSFLRNAGAASTTGRLLAFLDDDDEWVPGKIEKQVAFMSRDAETGMSYTFTSPINGHGIVDSEMSRLHDRLYHRHLNAGHSYEEIVRDSLIFTSSVMVRRETFEAVGGFREDLVGAEDWDFYLNVAKASRISVLPEKLVRYRIHSGNSAEGERQRQLRVVDARIRAALDHLAKLKSEKEIDSHAESLLLRTIGMNHYWADRNFEALRYLLAALRASPMSFASLSNVLLVLRSVLKSLQ